MIKKEIRMQIHQEIKNNNIEEFIALYKDYLHYLYIGDSEDKLQSIESKMIQTLRDSSEMEKDILVNGIRKVNGITF